MMFGGYAPEMEIDAAELAKLRNILREHPTAILFTHKTYIDGATPSRLTYDNDMPMLHLFGGANLDFAVMGEFFRHSGMIFIRRSEEHTSELQSLMRTPYAVFCLTKNNYTNIITRHTDN